MAVQFLFDLVVFGKVSTDSLSGRVCSEGPQEGVRSVRSGLSVDSADGVDIQTQCLTKEMFPTSLQALRGVKKQTRAFVKNC